jgi:hypothetical protein
MIWFFVWWKVVKSEPEQDPNISPEELKYIQDSLGNTPHKVHLKANSHIPCRSHAVPLGFRLCLSRLIYTVRPCLIHTCHATSMPF